MDSVMLEKNTWFFFLLKVKLFIKFSKAYSFWNTAYMEYRRNRTVAFQIFNSAT